MEKTTLNSMFENLLHIWNKTNFWNTKMRPYIYGAVNGIHVINLVETNKKLEEVKKELAELSASWKKILFVTTKIQSRDAFKKLAQDTGHFYVAEKWVPGLLTNFRTIRKRINSYIELSKEAETNWFTGLTKKEKASKMLELEKLEKAYAWLKDMKKMPDLIFASDWIYERQALKEAKSLKIRSMAIFSTNGDIDLVNNLIPANTNSTKSFDFLAGELKSSLWTVKTWNKATVKKVEQKKVSWEEKPKRVSTTKKVEKES